MPADLTPKAIDALVKRLRDWDITDDDKFLIADALTALEAQVERLTGALAKIKAIRPRVIDETGFQTGPASMLNEAQAIARAALSQKDAPDA